MSQGVDLGSKKRATISEFKGKVGGLQQQQHGWRFQTPGVCRSS